MEQIIDYRKDPGNGYTKTLLCFVQLFIVSNRTDTWYFANYNVRLFAFDADAVFAQFRFVFCDVARAEQANCCFQQPEP